MKVKVNKAIKNHNKLVKDNSINYDLLKKAISESILTAEQRKKDADEQQKEEKRLELLAGFSKNRLLKFFQVILYQCKHPKEGIFVSFWMVWILQGIFYLLSGAFLLLSVAIVYSVFIKSDLLLWHDKSEIFQSVYIILFTVISIISSVTLSLISYGTAKDIEQTKDKDYLSSVFAGFVSFVALIVSITAFVKR